MSPPGRRAAAPPSGIWAGLAAENNRRRDGSALEPVGILTYLRAARSVAAARKTQDARRLTTDDLFMAKTSEQVLVELTQIVSKQLGDPLLQLKPETIARDVKNWDSLRHIEIVLAVEKHFKMRFNFAELQKFKNLGQMCDNIAAKLAKAG